MLDSNIFDATQSQVSQEILQHAVRLEHIFTARASRSLADFIGHPSHSGFGFTTEPLFSEEENKKGAANLRSEGLDPPKKR